MRMLLSSRRRSFSVLLLLLGWAATATTAAQPQKPAAGSPPVPLIGEVRAGTLPNGLRYFIRPNKRPEGRAELRLIVNAGSILEDDDQLGAAHFIEHMSFNGTRRFPKNELVSYLQSVGVRLGGDLNATTGYDETIYILPIPVADKNVFDTGLAILREWAGNASLTDADIEAERGVVQAELRSGQAAEERVRRQALLPMFNGSRYADRLPIGTAFSLRSMTPDALRRFYHDWYRPDLQAVIVVGDIDVDQVEARVKTLFGDIPKPVNPRLRPARFEIRPRTNLDALVVADSELPSGRIDITRYMRPQPSMTTVAAYDALIKDQLVNRMLGMRLYELTDRPNRPFLAAQAQRTPTVRGYEAFVASAAIAGQDPAETTRILATEIERARRFGFTEEELAAAKQDVLGRYAQLAAEGNKAESDSLADELGRHFLTDEPVPGIAWEFGRVKEFVPGLPLDAINAHAQMVLEEPGMQPFVLAALPQAGSLTADTLRGVIGGVLKAEIAPYRGIKVATALLEHEPAPGSITSETVDPDLGTTTIAFANGTRVVLKPTDFKNDEVVLAAGRYGGQYLYEQADHQNAVNLVGTIDAMGYGSLTPIALQRFLSTHRADVDVDFGRYTEELEGGSTRDDIATLLQLVYLKMTAPRLDPERLNSNRAAMKGYLMTMANSPERQFEDFSMAVLSQDHPRAPRLPKPEDLDKVNAERSVAMYRERIGNARGMNFVLTGSFSVADVKPLLAKYIGGLPAAPQKPHFRDVGVRYPSGTIDKALESGAGNSAVTVIYSGQKPYSVQEALKLDGLTEVLRLRVIDRIREQLGTAYSPGVYSTFSSVPVGEYALRFWIACSPEQADTVNRTIDGIIKTLQTSGPTTGELEKVTRTWLNEHASRVRTNQYWANRLRTRAIDPALDDEADFVARVKALTVADIQAAARTYADGANRVLLRLEPEALGAAR